MSVIGPPQAERADDRTDRDEVRDWRKRWGVASWADDDPFADVRSPEAGRPDPW